MEHSYGTVNAGEQFKNYRILSREFETFSVSGTILNIKFTVSTVANFYCKMVRSDSLSCFVCYLSSIIVC